MPINLLLIGPPGVGKGTQAALLQDRLGLVPLASGDIFRKEIYEESELGKKAQKFIIKGNLVPDEVTIAMMTSRISTGDAATKGFVLDGFPRSTTQAVALDKFLEENKLKIDRIVSLVLNDDIIVERLSGRRLCPNCGSLYHLSTKPPKEDNICDKCGHELKVRKDDKPDTIRQRLRVFHETTEPLLSHYQSQGKTVSVPADQSPEEVYAQITEGLVT